jgi:hypothetical protein
MRRVGRDTCVVVILLTVLSACGADSQAEPREPRRDDAPASAASEQGDGASVTAPPAADTSQETTVERAGPSDPADELESEAGVAFVMPSTNVTCVMRPEWTACQIEERDFAPASSEVDGGPRDDCDADAASAIVLQPGEPTAWVCMVEPLFLQASETALGSWAFGSSADDASDFTETIAGRSYASLPYGTRMSEGDITCLSESTGVECTTARGEGFRLARADYDIYG